MYATVDALTEGNYFYMAMLFSWPVPFDLKQSPSASLLSDSGRLALIFARRTTGDDPRFVIQVRDVQKQEVMLEAMLSAEMTFLRGDSHGMAVDEVGAAEALAGFKTSLIGSWVRGEELGDLDDEGVSDE